MLRARERGWDRFGQPSAMCVFCAKDFVAAKLHVSIPKLPPVCVCVSVYVCVCANIFALLCSLKWDMGVGEGDEQSRQNTAKKKNKTRKNYENENL